MTFTAHADSYVGGWVFWRILGWIAVVWLALQSVYGLFYHQRPFLRLSARARLNPETGEVEGRIHDPLADRLANQYLRRVQLMFVIKLAAIGLLLYVLLR